MNYPDNCAECEETDICKSFHYGDENCKYKEEIAEKCTEKYAKTTNKQ